MFILYLRNNIYLDFVKDEMYAYTAQEHEQLNTIASAIQISNVSGNVCSIQGGSLVQVITADAFLTLSHA